MATGVEELVDMLFSMIDEAKGVPLSSDKCIIERDKALDLLDEIKAQFPVELGEAKKLLDMDEDAPLEPEKTLRALREKYRTENVIMTMGGEGYAGLEGERYFSGAQIPVSPIVDTSGAGDGFLSAMVVNLHWGKNLEEACRWANKYAARVVLVDGTLKGYSTVEELEAFYRERGESL